MNNKERFTMLAHIAELETERDRLRDALENMLKSADCVWEDRDMGHDWPEACQQARAALQEDSDDSRNMEA